MKPAVLILCTGNSCRSQMAEGILRAAAGDLVDVCSAGSAPAGRVHPKAIQVMREIGIDISGHTSKPLTAFLDRPITTVITVCGDADKACPAFPGEIVRHRWGFDDPARAEGTEQEILGGFRRVRDQIRLVFEAYASGLREGKKRAESGPAISHEPSSPIHSMNSIDPETVRNEVRRHYGAIAASDAAPGRSAVPSSCCGGGSAPTAGAAPAQCGCSSAADSQARTLGYSDADIAAVPDGANLGLGCGNPVAIASLKPGQTVLDLGAGAGFDAFLAAEAVGPAGRVIGVDMTPEMVAKARANAKKGGFSQVEFRLGEIEALPVADGIVDVVISNCVINLCPDKRPVYREAFRALKPGGRLAVSDVVAHKELPDEVKQNLTLHSCCLAGATPQTDLLGILREAGFVDIVIRPKGNSSEVIKSWEAKRDFADKVFAAEVTARKPTTDEKKPCCCFS